MGEAVECRVALAMLREHEDWKDHAFLFRPEIVGISASAGEREAVFAFREREHFLSPALEALARAI